MLYHLFFFLQPYFSAFNIFRYITFRTIYAAITAFMIVLLLGPWVIKMLRRKQIGQYIREDGPRSHYQKAGTPTMGGLLILLAVMVSALLWMNLTQPYIWIIMLVVLGYGAIGFMDDYLKINKKQNLGLGVRGKLCCQAAVGLTAGVLICFTPDFNTALAMPFFKSIRPDLGWMYAPFAMMVIVGASNAVNLTDGLDGLAIGPIVIAAVTYMIFAYTAGHYHIAEYLQIPYIKGSAELTILCGILAGAGLGFLWFNTYPAQIFMGDVGSLPLGACLGCIAVITKQELLLVIVGGLFVMEALSVIAQVGFFKMTNGKRIFRMAPLHHHYELKGWPEPKVIVRFWIIAMMLALTALSTLKIR